MRKTTIEKQQAGHLAFHSGVAAELAVERFYADRGFDVLARRWRGAGGEIDLIAATDDLVVFVEVKKARSFASAALRVSRAQKHRIFAAATEFVGRRPAGQLSDIRFDVALVDCSGAIEVLENALQTD